MPHFDFENEHEGAICGVDEVGRGPLAGPVVAACVHIPRDAYGMAFIQDIKDSKRLSHKKLTSLYTDITTHFDYGIASLSPDIIDEINIGQASLRAMEQAVRVLDITPDFALIDGNRMPQDLPCPARTIIKGDDKSYSIAAASIVAKFTRDQLMRALHQQHPHYGWDRNVGYPTKAHRDAINAHGITPHHRKTFAPVENFIAHGHTAASDKKPTLSVA